MANEVKDPGSTSSPAEGASSSTSDSGVRPLVKIGGKLTPPADTDGSQPPLPAGDWSFEYRPGEKTLAMTVQVNGASFLKMPQTGEVSMSINADGLQDLIAWLYGVKNSIANMPG
ncbi:hypothetical protein FKG94_14250 [Exilibacterium tricleocarpae]|uniref:Uncharacterized protein n=1 Tax=Exilibacterium tricleocarpae TaxID=2591008 RepID=A0A545TM18_9GAMM|nr:hypothetical protein [Exilibacterium tricleocarpae]TQV78226.1 hypothetical protein FKG94_14250 [Exilibacterium tricleocarpae]